MDTPSASARYKPELNWLQIVYSEIVAVTTAMRRNQRWQVEEVSSAKHSTLNGVLSENLYRFLNSASERTGFGSSLPPPVENALLYEFSKLKTSLGTISNLRDLDPSDLLHPFLQVITSVDTTGNITGAALLSVYNFINYRILDPHHPDLARAVVNMTTCVTRCKFQTTDIVSDEIVLANILKLLRTMAQSEIGKKCISDKGICEMVEVAFRMHLQSRISELLKKSAEDTLLVLTQCMFERLVVITRESEHREAIKGKLKTHRIVKQSSFDVEAENLVEEVIRQESVELHTLSPKRSVKLLPKLKNAKPFGIPAILEFTRVLITLIDPKDHRHTDTLHRALGLKLAARCLEVGGQSLAKWVRAGFVLEKEMGKSTSKELIDLNLNSDMTIVTDQPATVVSVGAEYAAENEHLPEISSPKPSRLDTEIKGGIIPIPPIDKEILHNSEKALHAENHQLLHPIDKTSTSKNATTLTQASPIMSQKAEAEAEKDEMEETNFQNLAMNIKRMIVDDLTRHLFQLLIMQNTTNVSPPSWSGLNTISLVLRAISILFSTMKEQLIPQHQWFIQFLMKACESGVSAWDIDEWAKAVTGQIKLSAEKEDSVSTAYARSSEPILVSEVRDLYFETLLQICRSDTVYAEMYIFHDTCLSDKSHIFEELLKFFAKFSFPDTSKGGSLTTVAHQNLAFDGLLVFLRCLNERRMSSNSVVPQDSNTNSNYTPEQLLLNKDRKAMFLKGADVFNQSAKKGITFFQEHGFLPKPLTPEAIAVFFSTSSNLSKTVIGDYLGRPDKCNQETLAEFVKLFNFEGKRIDEAMRLFLEKFRIPGESQMIERVLDAFSKKYYETIKSISELMLDDPNRKINTEEDTCVLAFSIIMLNTDQHNPQVKRRMGFVDYTRNVRGLNSGQDFSPEYLQSIYSAIQQNEIVLAEERGGDLGFNYEWKSLMAKMESIPHLSARDTNIYDKDLFALVSGPVIAAIFYVFENVQDASFFEKSLIAIQYAASIAAKYSLNDIFDFILNSLFRIGGISKHSKSLPIEEDFISEGSSTIKTERIKQNIDRWLIDFGRSYKGQVAVVLSFNLLKDYHDSARAGWNPAILSIGNLFLHQVLPLSLMTTEHFCKMKITIPRLVLTKQEKQESEDEPPKKEQGLFSSFAQFLSLSSSEYDDEHDEFQAAAGIRITKETVAHCCIEELLDETRFMKEESVLRMMEEMIAASFYPEQKDVSDQLRFFSQASIFYIEMLFKIVLRNRDRLKSLWPLVHSHLEIIVQHGVPAVLIERAVTNVLRLLLRLMHVDDIQSDVFKPLELLLHLKTETIHAFAEQLTAGFLAVAKTDMSIFSKNPSRWATIFRVLSIAATHSRAAAYSFELTCIIISDRPGSALTAEHFGECVDLLLSFSSGVIGTMKQFTPPLQAIVLVENGSEGQSAPKNVTMEMQKSTFSLAIDRALQAIEKLYNLHLLIPRLVESTRAHSQRAWFEFWLPVLSGLGQQCTHPAIDIRNQALSYLQKIFLSEELRMATNQDGECQHRLECFDIILFPLLDELVKMDLSSESVTGSEVLVRTCVLVTKVFMRFSPFLLSCKEYNRVWAKILDNFGLLMQLSAKKRNDFALEGIQESLKNAILVLMADGVIKQPEDGVESNPIDVWNVTWDRVDSFCPSIKADLWSTGSVPQTE